MAAAYEATAYDLGVGRATFDAVQQWASQVSEESIDRQRWLTSSGCKRVYILCNDVVLDLDVP